jgi:hypothetical protein
MIGRRTVEHIRKGLGKLFGKALRQGYQRVKLK